MKSLKPNSLLYRPDHADPYYYLPVPPLAQLAPVAWAGYHIMTDKVEIFTSEKSAIDWRDQYQPGFARVEKLVSGGVVE
jgi:hypothetical protein